MVNFQPAYPNTQSSNPPVLALDRHLLLEIGISVVLLALSLVSNFYAGMFATENVSNPVTDIILDNVPVINVDFAFVEGPLFLWMLVGVLLVLRPGRIPFVFKGLALFILVRSGFIILTHLGPFPTGSKFDVGEPMRFFTFRGDFFFSGHTGSPFLLALMFWKDPKLRLAFLGATALFGAAVLLGHLHYSIDVFAAFFISYGIHDLARFLFRRDWELFDGACGANERWQLSRLGLVRRPRSISEPGVE
ncbi:hypothetical protein AU467_06470 [Mesorhizobium loti]|uniref:Sphingomyelin synthase-like domain-containing protein n=1 Tax=Rhizobium loti TaxID=381 RepID=A0A117N292_RHILI|nr:hypothetical protein AU467_06470 [Mesorhizobium loti]